MLYPPWVVSGDWITGRGGAGTRLPCESPWSVTDPRSLLERDLHRAPKRAHTRPVGVSIERVRAPIRSSMDVAERQDFQKSSLSLLRL